MCAFVLLVLHQWSRLIFAFFLLLSSTDGNTKFCMEQKHDNFAQRLINDDTESVHLRARIMCINASKNKSTQYPCMGLLS